MNWSGDPNFSTPKFPFFQILAGALLITLGGIMWQSIDDPIEIRAIDSYTHNILGFTGEYEIVNKTPTDIGTKTGWDYTMKGTGSMAYVWLKWDLPVGSTITFHKPMFTISEDMKK